MFNNTIFICIILNVCFSVLYSGGSFNCHGLSYAAPEACLAHIGQYLGFGILKHPDNICERGANFRVGIPAAGHDVTQNRQTIIWDCRSYSFVHHSKGSLNSSHVLEWKRACYELPKNNSKAVHIHLLCIRPMLNHLSA